MMLPRHSLSSGEVFTFVSYAIAVALSFLRASTILFGVLCHKTSLLVAGMCGGVLLLEFGERGVGVYGRCGYRGVTE